MRASCHPEPVEGRPQGNQKVEELNCAQAVTLSLSKGARASTITINCYVYHPTK